MNIRKCGCVRASFTVEAALLMTIILPVLLALIYYGFFLHDKGVLNGAAQQITAQADLNHWKKSGNNRLAKQAGQNDRPLKGCFRFGQCLRE